jgi:hypothetical protein
VCVRRRSRVELPGTSVDPNLMFSSSLLFTTWTCCPVHPGIMTSYCFDPPYLFQRETSVLMRRSSWISSFSSCRLRPAAACVKVVPFERDHPDSRSSPDPLLVILLSSLEHRNSSTPSSKVDGFRLSFLSSAPTGHASSFFTFFHPSGMRPGIDSHSVLTPGYVVCRDCHN